MQIFFKTDIGNYRLSNQDDCKVGAFTDDEVWAVVCDGMGGHNGGNIASAMATSEIEKVITTRCEIEGDTEEESFKFEGYHSDMTEEELEELLNVAVQKANYEVYLKSRESAELYGMGTTVEIAFIRGSCVYLAHAGDSRVYLANHEKITQLTKDHSVVQQMVDAGKITSKEAKVHPQKNLITRALGVESDLEVDFIKTERFEEGSTLVMCSDGLSNYFDDEELLAIINTTSIDMLADTFVANALARGGDDNITVVVISNRENEAPNPLEDVQPAEESQQPDEADTPADSE